MRLAIKICLIATLCAGGLATIPCVHAQTQFQLQKDEFPNGPEKVAAPEKRKPDRIGLLYLASEGVLAGGTWWDAKTTSDGLDHPTMAYRKDDNAFLMRYVITEVGWAGTFAKRDAFAASTANILLNVGVAETSRRLYHRGGRWRMAAIGLNLAKGGVGMIAGYHNQQLNGSIDQRVRMLTGYRGAIVWSH